MDDFIGSLIKGLLKCIWVGILGVIGLPIILFLGILLVGGYDENKVMNGMDWLEKQFEFGTKDAST